MLRIISIMALSAVAVTSSFGQDEFRAYLIRRAITPPVIESRELVNSKDPAKWQGMVKINTERMRSGKGCFELDKYTSGGIESELIPVDFTKTYRLSCFMRSLDGANPASGDFGLMMYDQNKRPITYMNVCVVKDSETVLAAPVVKDSRDLRIDGNPKWLGVSNWCGRVAFNIKDHYADLPNFECSPQIEKVVEENKQCKIVLREPLNGNYPAGTKVRLHSFYNAPLYGIAWGWMPAGWEQFSATIKGEAPVGTPATSFWRGTRFVRVYFGFGNYDKIPRPGAILLVDDIHFVEE